MTASNHQRHQRCVIVVPCYEEAARLPRAAFAAFIAQGHPIHFLFVNDGSKDATLALLTAMQQEHGDAVSILDKKINGGKGEAIRDGMLAAIGPSGDACDLVGFWDADLATPLDAIPGFVATLRGNPALHMVFGARVRLLGRTIVRKAARHYAGRLFATLASLVLRLPIYDTQCGAKLYRAGPDLAQVLARPFLSRWIFDVELIARSIERCGHAFCHAAIYEYPLMAWRDVDGSKLKPTDFLRAAAELFGIYRQYPGLRRID